MGRQESAEDAFLHMQIEHDMRKAGEHFHSRLASELKKAKIGHETGIKILQWLNPSQHNPHFLSTGAIFLIEDAGGRDEAQKTYERLMKIKYMLKECGIQMQMKTGIEGDVPVIELRIEQEKEEVLDAIVKSALNDNVLEFRGQWAGEGAGEHLHEKEIRHEHEHPHAIHENEIRHGHEHEKLPVHPHIHPQHEQETHHKQLHQHTEEHAHHQVLHRHEKHALHRQHISGEPHHPPNMALEEKIERIMQRQKEAENDVGFASASRVVMESAMHEMGGEQVPRIEAEKSEVGRRAFRMPKNPYERPTFDFAQSAAMQLSPQMKILGDKHDVDAGLIFPPDEIRRWIMNMFKEAKGGQYMKFGADYNERVLEFYKDAAREIMDKFLDIGVKMEIRFAKDRDGKLAAKTEFEMPLKEMQAMLARKNEERQEE